MILLFFLGIFLGTILFLSAYKNKHFDKVVGFFILCGLMISLTYSPITENLCVVGDRATLNKFVFRKPTEPPAICFAKYINNNDLFVNAETKDGITVNAFIYWQYQINANEQEYVNLANKYGPRTHDFHIRYMIDKHISETFVDYAKTVTLDEINSENQMTFIGNFPVIIENVVKSFDIPLLGRSKIETLII